MADARTPHQKYLAAKKRNEKRGKGPRRIRKRDLLGLYIGYKLWSPIWNDLTGKE